jgi:hypothetical protein
MYFESAGRDNTNQVLTQAHERATTLGIDEIVLATTKGTTAFKALTIFNGFKVTIVTYHCGFKKPFENRMPADVRKDLEQKGAIVVTATHALSGLERSLAKKNQGIYPILIMADTLRLFGHGTKVAVEVTLMAADAGALSGNDVIAIGGTGRGADAALVIKPAHSNNLFDLRIREIICKPRQF